MALTREQAQTRFLAILLPSLTLCTHTLLALSFILPGSEQYRAYWSLSYNVIAAGASVAGLIGAVRLLPPLISAYTLIHTTTLSFVTLALTNIIIPFDAGILNPVIPSWYVDEDAICRDIDAGLGWDEAWLVKCSRNFFTVMVVVAWSGLFLMFAQWWALWTVRRWGREIRIVRARVGRDVEMGKEGNEKMVY
ncbi:hypothetical protein CC86DRAFT_448870 [Ophiobolus disseminans]|uniref:MARVEL domain-containing protein n=1 Tax=Ophiobolus disseminans TaxID=1469910 RepID=A0A6A6ZME1_9PLEO|nr:hypothetical protein CC86DRAFT_448870 [Ophiobolus disseminans]